jgi:hypothetical protein
VLISLPRNPSRSFLPKLAAVVGVCLFATGNSFAAAKPNSATTNPGPSLVTENAGSSDGFVDSMGVVIHLEESGIYQTGMTTIVEPALVAAGFRHVREGGLSSSTNAYGMNQIYGPNGMYQSVANYVQANGGHRLGFVLQMAPLNLGSTNGVNSCDELTKSPVSTLLQYLPANLIDGFEGMNEYDWQYNLFTPNCETATSWAAEDAAFQQALYADVKSNPATAQMHVAGPSFGTTAGMAEMGNVSAYEDFATQHSYPDGRYPSADIAANEAQLVNVNGTTNPYVATETGYYSTPDGVSGISEAAQAKYMTRLYFEYFNNHVLRTYTYELIDEANATGWHAHFGLLRADGSRKPAFAAVSNVISILSDPGAAMSPGTLNYSLGNVPATLHHTLLQRRNGAYELAVWQEVTSYNLMKEQDVVNANVATTLTLGFTASSVSIYDPLVGTAPVDTYTGVSSVNLQIPDHALIIEIQP